MSDKEMMFLTLTPG